MRAGSGPEPGPAVPSPGTGRRPGWRTLLSAVLVVGGGAAAFGFRDRIADWWGELVHVRWQWVLFAAVVQLLSIHCVVLVQRVLLAQIGRAHV